MKKSGFIQQTVKPSFLTILAATSIASSSGQTLLEEERRRRDNVIAAEEAIMAGDSAYLTADYQGAVAKYRQAYEQISIGEKTKPFRNAAKERYAQAAVEAARVMNRQGDRAGAIQMVDEVLADEVFPAYLPAQQFRAQLDDPIRVNPAATKEHAQNIDEVRRLLYKAEGSFNLGDYDQSNRFYEAVLRIDSYNKAARRGMERNSAYISDYAGAALDQTRAELLAETDAGWEIKKRKESRSLSEFFPADELRFNGDALDRKLDEITIPFVDFDETTLEEAIEFLEGQSRVLDTESDLDKKGLDFVLDFGARDTAETDNFLQKTISVRLRNVPLREVLNQVTRLSRTQYRVDSFAVLIQPLGGITNDLIVRRYSVPPDFLSQSSKTSDSDDNPFGGGDEEGARLAPRLTAREFFEQQGLVFPDGASVSYNSSFGELTAKTSSSGHDEIRGVVDALNLNEPAAVIIDTKFVRISQENLEELGFDVTLADLSANSRVSLNGGSIGNGRASDFSPSPLTGGVFGTGNPVTSGLRSGDFAVRGDAINEILDRAPLEVTSSATTAAGTVTVPPNNPLGFQPNSAPGFLSVLGAVDNHGLSVLFRGLDQKRSEDSLSQPSVITRSGQQAVIESVREFVYPTEYEPPEVPNSSGGNTTLISGITGQVFSPTNFFATPAHPTAFETRKLGTILEVQPTVSADRTYADVSINVRMDEFLGFINYGVPIQGGSSQGAFAPLGGILITAQSGEVTPNDILQPLFDSVRLDTNVSVANGKTVVLGGLVTETVENVQDKVPILGDLPFIGRAFSTEALQREKMALLIFVTIRIVDPAGNPIQN